MSRIGIGRPRTDMNLGSHLGDIDRAVAAHLDHRRRALGMSIKQVNERAGLGCSYQQMSKYLRGGNRVSAAQLHAICSAVGWQIGDAFKGLEVDVPRQPEDEALANLMEAASVCPPEIVKALSGVARALADWKTTAG